MCCTAQEALGSRYVHRTGTGFLYSHVQDDQSQGAVAVQDVDRFSAIWWYADVPQAAVHTVDNATAIVSFLRDVSTPLFTTQNHFELD